MSSFVFFKVLYFLLFLISHIVGSIIGNRIKPKNYSFLIDLFCGSFLLSFSLNHIYNVADSESCFKSYPYQSLISIIIFSFLTLFSFIKDSTNFIDESMLLRYDTTGSSIRDNQQYTLNTTDGHQFYPSELDLANTPKENNAPVQNHKPKFRLLDNLHILIFYLISFISSISFGLYLSTYTKDQLNQNCPYFIVFRFFESIILSVLLSRMPVSQIIFWAMIILHSLFSFFIIISNKSSSIINYFYRISYSFLLGCYFYFGSLLLHNGISDSSKSFIFSLLIIIFSFALPYTLTIGIDYKI